MSTVITHFLESQLCDARDDNVPGTNTNMGKSERRPALSGSQGSVSSLYWGRVHRGFLFVCHLKEDYGSIRQ